MEAQANGLSCFGTEERVPHEVALTDTIKFLSLKLPAKKWAETICKTSSIRNAFTQKQIIEASYDINMEATKLFLCYKELHDGKNS